VTTPRPPGKRDQKNRDGKRRSGRTEIEGNMDGNEGGTYLDMENDAVGKAFGSPPVSAQVCLHLFFIHLLF
jgi:hypothetical protein